MEGGPASSVSQAEMGGGPAEVCLAELKSNKQLESGKASGVEGGSTSE